MRARVGLLPLLGLAGCGDLFHGTDWATRCDADPEDPACEGAGGASTSGPSGPSGPSASTGSGGGGGSPAVECEPGATETCEYPGPEETLGVGECAAGTRTCEEDGSGFSACVGRVLPSSENCKSPEDESCDGKADCAGEQRRRFVFGGTGTDLVTGLAVAPDGSSYVAGYFTGQISVASASLESAGGSDVFVAKLDAAGALLWSKRFGGAGEDVIAAAAALGSDGVVLFGCKSGSVDFDGISSPGVGTVDGFLLRLGADGAVAFVRALPNACGATGSSVVALPDGGVLAGGALKGEGDLGFGTVTGDAEGDAYVIRLAPNGDVAFSRVFAAPGSQIIQAVAAGEGGAIHVGGDFTVSVDLGQGAVASAGGKDAFVAKLNASGAADYVRVLSSPEDASLWALALDPSGLPFVGGFYRGTLSTGAEALPSVGGYDAFVVKLDAAGAPTLARRFGGAGDDLAWEIAVDAAGQLALGGYFGETFDLGGVVLSSAGLVDAYVAKLAPDLSAIWARTLGGPNLDFTSRVALSATGDVFWAGGYLGPAKLGNETLSGSGLTDGFLVKQGP